jgi:hypothetical protein
LLIKNSQSGRRSILRVPLAWNRLYSISKQHIK